jgi:hypothetical protein
LESGGYTGMLTKTNKNLPSININPIDNFERIKDGKIVEKGKIDTLGYSHDYLLINFYPNGLKVPIVFPYHIFAFQTDTLVIGLTFGVELNTIDNYYKKIR